MVLIYKNVLKKLAGGSLYVVAFTGYVFLVALLLRLVLGPINEVVIISQIIKPIVPQQIPITAELPSRLKIPELGLDAVIAYAGLTTDGAMAILPSQDDVAWFDLGVRPGDVGSAVIAGHYGWDKGKGSVFNNLHTLQSGDKVLVSDVKGGTATFVVRESRLYDPEADASTIFQSNDGKAHLNLITCDGVWESAQKTYTGRLVMFTDKETK